MSYIIVGLGNPGGDYEGTRHNVGRMTALLLATNCRLPAFKHDKKINAQITKGKIGKTSLAVVLPEGFMNNSGKSLKPLITNEKKAEKLVVIYDDLDLPFGVLKISFNRGSGGHRGVESIIKHIKTKKFIRVRVGICPATPSGKLKKPAGEKSVIDFILGQFKQSEEKELKKILKKASEAVEAIIVEGCEKAMGLFN